MAINYGKGKNDSDYDPKLFLVAALLTDLSSCELEAHLSILSCIISRPILKCNFLSTYCTIASQTHLLKNWNASPHVEDEHNGEGYEEIEQGDGDHEVERRIVFVHLVEGHRAPR